MWPETTVKTSTETSSQTTALVETAGTFHMLQACIQGYFFMKPRKICELRVVNHVQ